MVYSRVNSNTDRFSPQEPPVLKILHTGISPESNDVAFSKIADLLGVASIFISVTDARELINGLGKTGSNTVLALGCKSLAHIITFFENPQDAISCFNNRASFVYIYGITPGSQSEFAIRAVTDNSLGNIKTFPISETIFNVQHDRPEITRHFTGLSFGKVNQELDYGLEILRQTPRTKALVTVDKGYVLSTFESNGCIFFLHTTAELIDVTTPVDDVPCVKTYFSRLIPAAMFIKYVYGEYCWNPPAEIASLIIDDPLLSKTYGYVNYKNILEHMNKHNFHATVAFIPWNYRRTPKHMARMFLENSIRLSVCIHGCDHTRGEFGTSNYARLDKIIKTALMRMASHQTITGIPYGKVMVFPQGVFSSASLQALKSNNFDAAVNSDIVPTDSHTSLTLGEVLQPAIMSYHSFPLYYRRYPGSIESFAFDLFFGKPCLICTHHHDFRDIPSINSLVDSINSISPNIVWTDLNNVAQRSYLLKKKEAHLFHVRLFGSNVAIDNPVNSEITFEIHKQEKSNLLIDHIQTNEQDLSHKTENGDIHIRLKVPAHETCYIRIIYSELDAGIPAATGINERGKILARRIFSEFRDNYVSKLPVLLCLWNKLNRLFSNLSRQQEY